MALGWDEEIVESSQVLDKQGVWLIGLEMRSWFCYLVRLVVLLMHALLYGTTRVDLFKCGPAFSVWHNKDYSDFHEMKLF